MMDKIHYARRSHSIGCERWALKCRFLPLHLRCLLASEREAELRGALQTQVILRREGGVDAFHFSQRGNLLR